MKIRRNYYLTVLIVVLGTALAACGGKDKAT